MTNYVVGFLFSSAGGRVVLVQKIKPDWQRGRLNGVGGKVERGESYLEAMDREFMEEAGLSGLPWEQFASLGGSNWGIGFFRARSEKIEYVRTCEAEKILVRPVCPIPHDALPNLHWLIPLALDKGLHTPVQVIEKASLFTLPKEVSDG